MTTSSARRGPLPTFEASLSALYAEGRFLGGLQHTIGGDTYTATNNGDVAHFTGLELLARDGVKADQMVYTAASCGIEPR